MCFNKEISQSMSEVDLIQLEWKKFTQKNIYSFLEIINKERELNPLTFLVIANACFEDVILKNVCLNGIRFINCKFKDCTILDSNLKGTEFLHVSFEDVFFIGNDMRSVGYFKSRLESVKIRRCIMFKNKFKVVSFGNVIIDESNLDDSEIRESNFDDIRLISTSGTLLNCPEEGSFIGFKSLCSKNGRNLFICKLEIPADAKRSSAFGRKCRCSKAKVLEIWDMDNKGNYTIPVNSGYSRHEPTFEYKVGEMVYPDSFDDNRWDECSNGIHFFITKQEAIDY